jgi:hypothetical protein
LILSSEFDGEDQDSDGFFRKITKDRTFRGIGEKDDVDHSLSEVEERDGSDHSPVRNRDPANAPWSCDICKDKRFT